MGWAVGERDGRHIGYGVPATCDQPGCGAAIDRGLSYACGGGVSGRVDNCGRFFCPAHLAFELDGESVCERCANDQQAFPATPDTDEWNHHILTDPSWAQWRSENPDRVAAIRQPVTTEKKD